jgi:hypothetical protein
MYTDKKFIFLFFCMSLLLVFNCAKIASPSPLRTDYREMGGTGTSTILISGNIVENRDSVGVQKYDEASWINVQFRGEIDTTSRGVRVINVAGREVPFTREWDVSPDVTELILKPKERLNYNTIYILKISGMEMYYLKGKHVDSDGDGVAGEVVDDDFVFPFVTFKTDNSVGNWQGIEADKIPPFITPSLKFLIGGEPTDYVWTDVNIALNIYDYTWDMVDTSIIVGALDTVTLNKNKFKIVEENGKGEVKLKDISYIGDEDSSDFGRIVIDPAHNLKPERFYVLKVLGGISDLYDNKLGRDDSVVFEKKFKTFYCNHDSTQCTRDTTAPLVLNWRNLGPSFEVSFSELIDSKSITKNSVYIPELEGELSMRNECGQTFVRFTTLKRVSVFGHTAFVTGEVSDLVGNKVKAVSYYFER